MRKRPDNVSENPAMNPTRTWDDTREVRMRIHLMTKAFSPEQKEFARLLLDGDWHEMDSHRASTVTFFNNMSSAHGYLNMIDIDNNRCSLTPAARVILSRVLFDDYRYED